MSCPFAHATADAGPRIFIVAELGVNHDGDPRRAGELLDLAAEGGADAVKLQLFRPERLLSREAVLAAYQVGRAGDVQELLAKLALPVEAMRDLRAKAREAGLRFVLTPFSVADIDDMAPLGVDAVKIASPDAVNPPLLRAAAGLACPMLVSTGTCDLDELGVAADLLTSHEAGGSGAALLQCVSSYPAPIEHAALGGIAVLRERFGLPTGYSDHTTSEETGALAVAAGAVVLEKHLTYDPEAAGPDHAASLDPAGFAEYVLRARAAGAMLGRRCKAMLPIEAEVRRVSRQSLCATRDLPAGHRLTPADLTLKRPGTGIPAAAWDTTLGRTLARAVGANRLLTETDLD